MTKPIKLKGQNDKDPRAFTKPVKPRDSVTKPIHQYTWPQDRTYEVVYEVIVEGQTNATMTETIKAGSYAHAAWRLARILPYSTTQTYNLLDVIRVA